MKNKLASRRNQRLNMAKAKTKQLEKGLGIKPDDSKQMANDYIIDCNKRKGLNDEPKFEG